MSKPWTVVRRGTDSSGRGVYASNFMWAVWLAVLAHPDVRPFAHKIVITQGAWMTLAGGGADDSAGYHDGGGCFDLRVWNLTAAEVATLIRVLRLFGIAAWLRNVQHGGFTDPHIHLVLGTDFDLDDGAAYQWRDYLAGGDGMGGRDYHPRPNPIVTEPPPEDYMATSAAEKKLDRIIAQGVRSKERDQKQREISKALVDMVAVIAEAQQDDTILVRIGKAKRRVLEAIAELETIDAEPEPVE